MADIGSYSFARTRREHATAGLKELQLREKTGQLVDLELIRRGLEGVIINQRTILLSVPAQIGREIDEPDLRVRVVALVDRRIREALEALSTYDPRIDIRDEDDHEDGAVDRAKVMVATRKKRTPHR